MTIRTVNKNTRVEIYEDIIYIIQDNLPLDMSNIVELDKESVIQLKRILNNVDVSSTRSS
jgi:RNase adaptor protein for sRNA GlmZ degradation